MIKEGIVLDRGNAGGWGSQAVDLAPAQGAIVEFQTAEDGMYVMVDHAFNFVGTGAVGIFNPATATRRTDAARSPADIGSPRGARPAPSFVCASRPISPWPMALSSAAPRDVR